MTAMTLMQILIQCENQLGWVPTGKGDIYRQRAVMHKVMRTAMDRQAITEADLALALAWCQRKRLPITSPLQLLPLVPEARRATAATPKLTALSTQVEDALAWEAETSDSKSMYWIGRLTRSQGPARAETLTEWQQAGRG